MKIITGKTFPEERALYNTCDALIENCAFDGEEDGESALKECKNITVNNCFFNLRYPLWHVEGFTIDNCKQSELCRASLWYSRCGKILNSELGGIKALRECSKIDIQKTQINSAEFGWKCNDISLSACSLKGEYAFFESSGLNIEKLNFNGKYSFQYCNNIVIKNSVLNTKDAFWHAKNVVCENCEITGEYLAWYSENLTFINCKIKGTQPLCYCKNLKLINCTMENCDLSFEYSEVDADIVGEITSVKNPVSGKILADSYGEIILSDSVKQLNAKILTRK